MPTPAKVLLPLLSHLLDQAFHSKSFEATSILHSHLLRTGAFADFGLHNKLFLSYVAAVASQPGFLPVITNLLTSTISYAHQPSPYNAAIAALCRHGFPSIGLQTLGFMHRFALPLDSYAFCSSLASATSLKATVAGRQIHACGFRRGLMSSIFVGGALIDFYSKVNAVHDARKVFDEMPLNNTICANALLSGYVESHRCMDCASLVRTMFELGLEPDECTLSAILRACAGTTDIRLGVQTHAYFNRRVEFLADLHIQSSLVEMYGKCGFIHKAQAVFESAARKSRRDVVLWTSMLNAYGRNGCSSDVIKAFDEMLAEGIRPDELAFLAVLSACSYAGRVMKGLNYFESMHRDYGIVPSAEHCGCVVDMLCRAGELEKAWKFADEMVCEKNNDGGGGGFGVSIWGALLSACREAGNVGIGEAAAKRALELEPENVGIYVELSNLYARVGMWYQIEKLRELLEKKGLKKDSGCSWLETTSV